MNIVHIITGLEDGGAEAVLFRLVTRDQANRHVVVSLGGMGRYGQLLLDAGIPVHTLDMRRGRLSPWGVMRLGGLLRAEKPEVVQTWMYHANLLGGLVARFVGIRRIFWGLHHTTLVPGTTGTSTRLVDWICARLSGWVPEGIIACAEESERVHIANGYHADKFTVIPNGYDVSVFVPNDEAGRDVRTELNVAADVPLLGLVGRWDPQKDHANLIGAFGHALARQPDARLVLVGTNCTSDNAALVALLKDAGVSARVHLLGRRIDVTAVMNALDLHVLSSYGEAFPNVVAEAMACGTPCVVTDVGDAAAIVGGTGWIVASRDSEALAGAIVEALYARKNEASWAERRKAARERIVDEFSLSTMVARYRNVWGT